MVKACAFCSISQGSAPASIVCENRLALAFLDLRQFHPGHVLVIPRRHLPDIRHLDGELAAALMEMVVRVTCAVGEVFPNQGLSVWHSIGKAAHQEVPHLHVHVHPRTPGDGMLAVYPQPTANASRSTLDSLANVLRAHLKERS